MAGTSKLFVATANWRLVQCDVAKNLSLCDVVSARVNQNAPEIGDMPLLHS